VDKRAYAAISAPILEKPMDLHADAELAQRLAAEAGRLLLGVRDAGPWADAESLRIAGDHAAQEFLAVALAASRPSDAVLSEEAVDDGARLLATRVWIIDPLDGTREFAEGRQDWAVHVALGADGELVAGAVALPGLGTVLSTAEPRHHLAAAAGDVVRIAVSRTRPPSFAGRVADRFGAELDPMGSAGYKVAAVLFGEVDAYLHAGGMFE
jgi:3'(2'), 5'-bisphosphate nucleotidase